MLLSALFVPTGTPPTNRRAVVSFTAPERRTPVGCNMPEPSALMAVVRESPFMTLTQSIVPTVASFAAVPGNVRSVHTEEPGEGLADIEVETEVDGESEIELEIDELIELLSEVLTELETEDEIEDEGDEEIEVEGESEIDDEIEVEGEVEIEVEGEVEIEEPGAGRNTAVLATHASAAFAVPPAVIAAGSYAPDVQPV